MKTEYGDLVKIENDYYLHLDDGYYDVKGGGYADLTNKVDEVVCNLAVLFNEHINDKLAESQQKLEQVKDIVE